MSREWKRVPTACFCGFCAPQRTIEKGEPALHITLPGVKRQRIRCQQCAGEAPPELPALPVHGDIQSAIENGFKKIGTAKTWKTRGEFKDAAREWMPYRDPGEEG